MTKENLNLDMKYFMNKFNLIVEELNDIYPEIKEDLRALFNIMINEDEVEGDPIYKLNLRRHLLYQFREFSKSFIFLEEKFDNIYEEIGKQE
jgi:hypothetical protein